MAHPREHDEEDPVFVLPGETAPPVLVVLPDGSFIHLGELIPDGLTADERELWFENQHDELMFGEDK